MKKSSIRVLRRMLLIGLTVFAVLLVATSNNGWTAAGGTRDPGRTFGQPRIDQITVQPGQAKRIQSQQIPLTFRIQNPGYSTDGSTSIVVDGQGVVKGVKPGKANVYAGKGSLHLKVAKIQVQPKKIIYLTFDDGPSRNITNQILGILKQNHIHATFFLVGQYVNYYPNMVKKIDELGNVIGIHSDTHRYQRIYKSNESLLTDVDRLDMKLEHILHKKIGLYRFPGGSFEVEQRLGMNNKKILIETLNQKGYRCFDWNASIGDASRSAHSTQVMIHAVEKQLEGHDRVIVLAHDMGLMKNTPKAMRGFIKYCKKKGYGFDTLNHYPGQYLFP